MAIKHRLYWTMQIGGWLLYALLQIVFAYVESGIISSPKRIIFLLAEAILCLLATHFFRDLLIQWKWLSLNMARLIPRIIASNFFLGLVIYFLKIPMSLGLGLSFDAEIAFSPEQITGQTFIYGIIFSLWSVLYFTYHYFERYNISLKYEASMVQIELNNLRSQLNPHFIFNALNSIRALIDENPAKSKQAINQLSNLLRNSLTQDKKGLTKFDDELRVVRDYLGLESIRFEERLQTEFDIHPDSSSFFVPPLMIQTIVENGIKHGISKLTKGGLIQVKTYTQNDQLKIHIRNSGHMVNGVKRSTKGLGIKNTQQRLKLLYGDRASFRIVNEKDNFVLTEIILPQTRSYESINR